jgi:hypothetical protein
MFCPPICPNCLVTLHWEHSEAGAPACPKCGHEHPEGLSSEDYEQAKAAKAARVDLPMAEWRVVTSRRNRGALDEWTEYLCVRRVGPTEAYEMAVCTFAPSLDEYDDESGDGGDAEFGPITDDAVVELNRVDPEAVLGGLRSLGWDDSDVRAAQQAIDALS